MSHVVHAAFAALAIVLVGTGSAKAQGAAERAGEAASGFAVGHNFIGASLVEWRIFPPAQ